VHYLGTCRTKLLDQLASLAPESFVFLNKVRRLELVLPQFNRVVSMGPDRGNSDITVISDKRTSPDGTQKHEVSMVQQPGRMATL
jgi:hypothetical protein